MPAVNERAGWRRLAPRLLALAAAAALAPKTCPLRQYRARPAPA